MEDTQSVGSSTWVITLRHSILSRCSLTFGHKVMGHFLGACITGCHIIWSQILYLPGNLPIPVNRSGNSYQVISGSDGLGCWVDCSRLICCCCGSRSRMWGFLCQVTWLWWHNSSLWLLAFHLRVDPGWQDWGCLWHTSMNLPSGVKHQGGLAAKWWATECTILRYMGPIIGGEWVLMWSRPVGRPAGLIMEGQHITSSSGVYLKAEWGCSLSAGTWRQLYGGICLIASWGTDISYHYLFGVSVSNGTIIGCINEQLIVCGCSLRVLPVAQAVATVVTLGWMPWRAIWSWGLWSLPTSMASVLPPTQGGSCGFLVGIWTSHAMTQLGCIPWQRCLPWLKWLATTALWSPVSNLVAFGAMGILCGAVSSASWVLLCTIGAVLGGCRWHVTITIVTGVGCLMLVMADCIHRFGAVGDLFSGMLNGKVVHSDVS